MLKQKPHQASVLSLTYNYGPEITSFYLLLFLETFVLFYYYHYHRKLQGHFHARVPCTLKVSYLNPNVRPILNLQNDIRFYGQCFQCACRSYFLYPFLCC